MPPTFHILSTVFISEHFLFHNQMYWDICKYHQHIITYIELVLTHELSTELGCLLITDRHCLMTLNENFYNYFKGLFC